MPAMEKLYGAAPETTTQRMRCTMAMGRSCRASPWQARSRGTRAARLRRAQKWPRGNTVPWPLLEPYASRYGFDF